MQPQQVQPPANQAPNPLFQQPFQQPAGPTPTPQPPIDANQGPTRKTKFLLGLAAVSVIELLLIIILAIVAVSGGKSANQPAKQSSSQSSQSQAPAAATSTGIQLNDDAISQSLSTLNDDQDFPTSKLSDQTLGL